MRHEAAHFLTGYLLVRPLGRRAACPRRQSPLCEGVRACDNVFFQGYPRLWGICPRLHCLPLPAPPAHTHTHTHTLTHSPLPTHYPPSLQGVPVANYSCTLGKEHTDFAEAKLQKRLIEGVLEPQQVDQLSVIAMAGGRRRGQHALAAHDVAAWGSRTLCRPVSCMGPSAFAFTTQAVPPRPVKALSPAGLLPGPHCRRHLRGDEV